MNGLRSIASITSNSLYTEKSHAGKDTFDYCKIVQPKIILQQRPFVTVKIHNETGISEPSTTLPFAVFEKSSHNLIFKTDEGFREVSLLVRGYLTLKLKGFVFFALL